jgi:hypothetical protein
MIPVPANSGSCRRLPSASWSNRSQPVLKFYFQNWVAEQALHSTKREEWKDFHLKEVSIQKLRLFRQPPQVGNETEILSTLTSLVFV